MAITEETLRRTNEVPGTRAHLSNLRTSAYKVRAVLNIIRGKSVAEARSILRYTDRGPAEPILKLLNSAVANAEHNDEQNADELFVAACYADEGVTMKRWRPRARGRAGRIRKRGSHITIVVARMSEEEITRLQASEAAQGGGRNRRVANSRANRVAASQSDVAEVDETTDEVISKDIDETTTSSTADTSTQDAPVADTTDEAEANEVADDKKEEGK